MHLTLHLTERCNLRCRYCYGGTGGGRDMTIDTMQRAIKIAAQEHRCRGAEQGLGVVFFGGEPLLRRDLIAETVRHCRSMEPSLGVRFHFKMTTNGLLLDDAFYSDPDTRDVFVALSHDGVREAHDAHRVDRRGKGSFDALEAIVGRLLAYRPYAPALMVITPQTVGRYAASVDFLFQQGFRYIIPTLDYGADWEEADLKILDQQYRALASWYYQMSCQEKKFFFSPFEVKIASHVRPDGCWKERCDLGQRELSVAWDGRFFPCVQFVSSALGRQWCIGDVQRGMDEPARQRLARLRSEEDAACEKCAVRHRCNHHCGCVSLRTTGRVDRVSPVLCAHERILLPIADQLAERLFRKRNRLFIHKHYNEFFPLVSAVEDAMGAER
jgi:uncharacterized protein